MMNFDIVYPKQLFKDFYKSIESYRILFVIVPIAVGLIMSLFVNQKDKEQIEGLINSSLTSFVPIFATILSVYISWVFTRRKTRHENDRIQLFQETTNEIFILIPLVLLAMFMYFLSYVSLQDYLAFLPYMDKISKYLGLIFNFFYYALFVEIALVILMITKRTYIIITNEVRLLGVDKTSEKTV